MICEKGEQTAFIKQEAIRLGFSLAGISRVRKLDEEEKRLRDWLASGVHSSMSYMENHFNMRLDPSLLVPGAKSIVSLAFNYFTDKRQNDPGAPVVSKYAFGRDYHKVLKKKLNALLEVCKNNFGDLNGRVFVDSAPVLERAWAKNAGLGWIGKNTLLIAPGKGSYFFLAELVLDVELDYDPVFEADHCGTCSRCIDACPTGAIDPEGYRLDAGKCISYLTIEHKETIPGKFSSKMANRVFGCDICMDVCPWNRFAKQHREPDFEPKDTFLNMDKTAWKQLSEDDFHKIFSGTPVMRAKYPGLKRNTDFLQD
ncbi:MAG TPA: tRNA epoxyqueuosine(34) reductase QueG [Saprospirales bacterium]|nr:tRNA epoxyqueuosine(34) reductase QueG [Saprospirales bacterium]HRQ30534.1 tRNA epoxyqueuosine(34) reductase QueG [Saprospiraceae bacterium]